MSASGVLYCGCQSIMKSNKIGILELNTDPFIVDVACRLDDLPVEFLSFADQPVPVSSDYKVVLDRLSHCFPYLKEMVRSMSLDGTYVINNPFSAAVDNKLIEASVCHALGIPFPKSIVLPGPLLHDDSFGVVEEPSWDRIAGEMDIPCVLKPIDGYGWEDVYVVNSLEELRERHATVGGGRTWLAQEKVHFHQYYRIFCINKKELLFIKWNPKPYGLGEYLLTDLKEIESVRDGLMEQIIRLNTCLDLDINTVEWCMDEDGRGWVVDAFNAVPDVPEDRLPPEYYQWIVDRFASCIRSKLESGLYNRSVFDLPVTQECQP